jgi:hypothetical protein
MLYAIYHEFISLTFEGDELYTVVNERVHFPHCLVNNKGAEYLRTDWSEQ